MRSAMAGSAVARSSLMMSFPMYASRATSTRGRGKVGAPFAAPFMADMLTCLCNRPTPSGRGQGTGEGHQRQIHVQG